MPLTTLPPPILHLICSQLTPTPVLVTSQSTDTIPSIHSSIINFSQTSRSIHAIASSHICPSIRLAYCSPRYKLFLRTILASPTYASHVQYLVLCESAAQEWRQFRAMTHPRRDTLPPLLAALHQLEKLYVLQSEALSPGDIMALVGGSRRGDMPLRYTLREILFDDVNAWEEERVVQIKVFREEEEEGGGDGRGRRGYTDDTFLTGRLKGLDINRLRGWPGVRRVEVVSVDGERDGDAESDGDWVDGGEDGDEVGEDSSDDGSEGDDSDYEDDWEAEGDWSEGGVTDVPLPE